MKNSERETSCLKTTKTPQKKKSKNHNCGPLRDRNREKSLGIVSNCVAVGHV